MGHRGLSDKEFFAAPVNVPVSATASMISRYLMFIFFLPFFFPFRVTDSDEMFFTDNYMNKIDGCYKIISLYRLNGKRYDRNVVF